jgi:hypothetical protein
MKLSDKVKLTPAGHLVPQVAKWDSENKGLSRKELEDLAVKLVSDNPDWEFITLNSLLREICSNHLVGYDTDSGLYFVCVRMPKSPYPDGYKSEEKLLREALLAQAELVNTRTLKALRELYSKENGFAFWTELSTRDFEKWAKENGHNLKEELPLNYLSFKKSKRASKPKPSVKKMSDEERMEKMSELERKEWLAKNFTGR